MSRIIFFLLTIIIPVVFSWWLFIPMALLYIYLAQLPYEIIVAGFILDTVYYFGDGFITKYMLTIFSTLLIIAALFLNKKIYWKKFI